MRILYLGMNNSFSARPFTRLLKTGKDICGLVLPAEPTSAGASRPAIARLDSDRLQPFIPLNSPRINRQLVHAARDHEVATFAVADLAARQTIAQINELQPDVACVACFPWRIPKEFLALAPLGFLNVHPSLLPAYRGPEPLFWIFRNGESQSGVTIHFMDEALDHGDIILQRRFLLPEGISGDQLEERCAGLGAELLVEALEGLRQGTLQRQRQPPGGSYFPWPTPSDFALDTGWPARRAFNFMRGTAGWGQPYHLNLGATSLSVTAASSFSGEEMLGEPIVWSGSEVLIQFTPGVLRARLA